LLSLAILCGMVTVSKNDANRVTVAKLTEKLGELVKGEPAKIFRQVLGGKKYKIDEIVIQGSLFPTKEILDFVGNPAVGEEIKENIRSLVSDCQTCATSSVSFPHTVGGFTRQITPMNVVEATLGLLADKDQLLSMVQHLQA